MEIKIIRKSSGLWVNPAPPYLLKYLQFSKRGFKSENYRMVNDFVTTLLYTQDGIGGIFTLNGFYHKIVSLIEKNLDVADVEDLRIPLPEIDWEEVKSVGLRDYQVEPMIEFLSKAQHENGIALCTGGWGKTYGIAATCAAWNMLNIIVAIPIQEVAVATYKKLLLLFPDKSIGLMGAGSRSVGQNITVTTFKSLKNCSIEKCQLLIADEIQSVTGDSIQEVISQIKPLRTLGFTATDKGTFSQSDKVIKGIFGERLIEIDYQEGVEIGAVVPGIVNFIKVPMQPSSNGDIARRLKLGIMKNDIRNSLIGEVCRSVPNKWQTLLFVDQIKNHLTKLYPFLPEGTKYIHRSSDKKAIKEYALTTKEQNTVLEEFINNEFQFLVATDCLRAGVDIQNCRVLIQCAGGSSVIEILQEAYRVSRILTEHIRTILGVDEKTHFVLIDLWDQHDDALLAMSEKRRDFYLKEGWKVNIVDSVDKIQWTLD